VPDTPLNVGNYLAGIGLIPTAIEVLGHDPKLDNEIVRQIPRLNLATLFPPEPGQRILVITHDDSGVRASREKELMRQSG
jgi:hypothetical protein